MPQLRDMVEKVRSKNAGPFWLTIDIFCGSPEQYRSVVNGLSSERVAKSLGADTSTLKRFDIAALNVVKFSLPRPQVQGSIHDRDMHGAGWAALIGELEVN